MRSSSGKTNEFPVSRSGASQRIVIEPATVHRCDGCTESVRQEMVILESAIC